MTAPAAAPRRAPRPAPGRSAAPARSAAPTRPGLRLVDHAAGTAGRLPFVLLVGAVLAGGLICLLMLHTLAAQDGFTLHKLQRQTATLADQQQALGVAVQRDEAPAALASRARRLGMVPTGSIAFVRLPDGRLVGAAHAAPAQPAAPKVSAPTAAHAAAPTHVAASTAAVPHPATTRPAATTTTHAVTPHPAASATASPAHRPTTR